MKKVDTIYFVNPTLKKRDISKLQKIIDLVEKLPKLLTEKEIPSGKKENSKYQRRVHFFNYENFGELFRVEDFYNNRGRVVKYKLAKDKIIEVNPC